MLKMYGGLGQHYSGLGTTAIVKDASASARASARDCARASARDCARASQHYILALLLPKK